MQLAELLSIDGNTDENSFKSLQVVVSCPPHPPCLYFCILNITLFQEFILCDTKAFDICEEVYCKK